MTPQNEKKFGVLFVCLGNICRSPLAEGICAHKLRAEGLLDKVAVDSSGTGHWHTGKPPHPDSQRVAKERGIDISGQRARQVETADSELFDLIVAMDSSNAEDLRQELSLRPGQLVLLREFDPEPDSLDVPDPYYGGGDGFVRVFDIIDRSMEGVLERIREGVNGMKEG